ncbi:MAG: serpin family protein [Labilithrix sp.]|nr:serpin family protein [Labilithrix sp.]
MKTAHAALPLLLTALAAGACSSSESGKSAEPQFEVARSSLSRETAPALEPAEATSFAADQATFAIDLYHAVAKEAAGEDVFLSPLSVSTALAMTFAGARGETRAEMQKALAFNLPEPRLHTAFNWLDLQLASRGKEAVGKDGKPFRLNVVNSTWGQTGFAFEAPFLDTLAVSYGAGVNLLDFRSDPEAGRQTINTWVEQKTEDRIKTLLPEGSLDERTRMVLVNAVYFNAGWATKFVDGGTQAAPFTKIDGATAQVQMMASSTTSRRYAETDDYQAVEIDYDGGEMAMLVVAPTTGSFATFEASLTGAKMLDVLAGLEAQQVRLSLPKFKLESGSSLKAPLESLGMKRAFQDDQADLTGISTAAPLVVKDVIHKTFVEIDENGTEAAAATAVIVGEPTSAPVDEPAVMTVDRPFVVAIVDRATKNLVFVGRILEPKL